MEEKINLGRLIKYGLLGILLLVIFFGSWFTVQPGQRAVVVTFGNVSNNVYDEGLHLKLPIIQQVKKINIKTQKEEVEALSASKDLQNVTTRLAINYSVDNSGVRKLFITVGDNSAIKSVLIDPAIQESIKAVTAKYTAEELITKRELVRSGIMDLLAQKLKVDGIDIIALNITNFKFSDAFDASIEQKVKAEQDALTQKNKLEQVKYEAQQQIESAKAQAEAIRIQAQAITSQGGEDYTKLKWIEKWNGQLPTYMLGDDTNLLMQMK